MQNGAYKALRSHHTLKDLQLAETWLYRIMLNECFQYVRRPKHISYERILDEEDANLGSTEDTYANIDLQNAIHMLPEKDKAVIILKYFEDKKLEEISHILDENISTVKSRLYRAMKKLLLLSVFSYQEGPDMPGPVTMYRCCPPGYRFFTCTIRGMNDASGL